MKRKLLYGLGALATAVVAPVTLIAGRCGGSSTTATEVEKFNPLTYINKYLEENYPDQTKTYNDLLQGGQPAFDKFTADGGNINELQSDYQEHWDEAQKYVNEHEKLDFLLRHAGGKATLFLPEQSLDQKTNKYVWNLLEYTIDVPADFKEQDMGKIAQVEYDAIQVARNAAKDAQAQH